MIMIIMLITMIFKLMVTWTVYLGFGLEISFNFTAFLIVIEGFFVLF